MKKRKRKGAGLILIILLLGAAILLYPTFSNLWNRMHSSVAIDDYDGRLIEMDDTKKAQMLEAAKQYNRQLSSTFAAYELDEAQMAEYESLLDITKDGIMGYIEIPSIQLKLPIYHGTEENVLQVGVGHLEWTSLPVGGEPSHCVLVGHRGLPSAELFSNLDKLTKGDNFRISVLGEELLYEVDQISTVLPEDVSQLKLEEGKDYCTLVTCTPYGINTHRLLVRGHRIENESVPLPESNPAGTQGNRLLLTLICLLLFLLLLLSLLLGILRKKRALRYLEKDL